MDFSGKEPAEQNTIPAQLRGEVMAYAVQSGFYNLAANFFEPYINYRIQRHYAPHAPHGNYTQNLAGEFAGDVVGASSLILAEGLFPQQLHGFSRAVRHWVDPLYTSAAHAFFGDKCHQPRYFEQIEAWKTFQERNLVRSAFMAATGIAGNVAAQKLLAGNPSPAHLIFQGKLVTTALTTALGLTARMAFPDQMRGMDSWIGDKVFTPMLEDKPVEKPHGETSHVQKLQQPGRDSEPSR